MGNKFHFLKTACNVCAHKMVAEEMLLPMLCDCELRKMWVGQKKFKTFFYSLSSYQLQFTGIISLQFKFFARQV